MLGLLWERRRSNPKIQSGSLAGDQFQGDESGSDPGGLDPKAGMQDSSKTVGGFYGSNNSGT